MTRGNDQVTKVYYKGQTDDFLIFVDDVEAARKWKNDRTIPLAQVLSGWGIFITHRHGAQGVLDTASKSSLANEFGTHQEEEVVRKILENGEVQEATNRERQGDRNQSNGPLGVH
jgi:ribosome maturation protein Sdo1